MKKLLCLVVAGIMTMSMSINCFAAEIETKDKSIVQTIYEKPYADGVDLIPANPLARLATKDYNSSGFSVGVYLQGAPFTMDSNGRAEFANANQACIDNTVKADVSYQVIDYYSNEVYSGTRKIGNTNGMWFNATSKVQAFEKVNIYLHNNNGSEASASGTFGW